MQSDLKYTQKLVHKKITILGIHLYILNMLEIAVACSACGVHEFNYYTTITIHILIVHHVYKLGMTLQELLNASHTFILKIAFPEWVYPFFYSMEDKQNTSMHIVY